MHKKEKMLLAEVEFWRFMIESRRGTTSEQAIERMQNACELAEHKLLKVATQPKGSLHRQ